MTSSYSRSMRTGVWEEDEEDAEILDDKTATLKDGTRLRITPKGQPAVEDLAFPGDIIESNYIREGEVTYSSKGKVIQVSKHSCYGLPIYTLVFVDVEAQPNKDGSYRESYHRWINECVAQEGRILKLFEANEDEILIVEKASNRQFKLTAFTNSVSKPTNEK